MKKAFYPSDVFDPRNRRSRDPEGLPYSHAVKASGALLFVSGQTAADRDGNILWRGNITKQTEVALENLKKVVQAAGLTMDSVVQLSWFVTDAEKFYAEGASALRRRYFPKDYPTSTLVQVSRLADPDALVEVQAIAVYD